MSDETLQLYNRLHNSSNPYQGAYKRVVTVCSAGLLRSPTAAFVLSGPPWNYNTRAAGIHDYALVPLDPVLVSWADEIVFMHKHIYDVFQSRDDLRVQLREDQKLITLNIEDRYGYRDPQLVQLINIQYKKYHETENDTKIEPNEET